jgi:3-hydroxyisobutyrate dehydrogenase-like beta-hydroxyacid dehydrogenase
MKTIAFIGLGIMGSGMAGNLAKKGFALTLWDRSPKKSLELPGAKRAGSIAEAVKAAEVVMYSLADDRAVEEVVFGADGVLAASRRGQIVLDMSTVHPETSKRQAKAFADRGVEFLDTPVFGSKNESAHAELWVLAGGNRQTFEKVRPILEAIGQTVNYMGPAGSGTSMKLVGNLVVALQLQAVGEAMVLASKAGLASRDVLEVFKLTDFRSPIISGVGAALIERKFDTNFALKHLYKDANLICRFAEELNSPAPALAAVRETIKTAMNQGWAEENASAMIKALELEGNVTIGEK